MSNVKRLTAKFGRNDVSSSYRKKSVVKKKKKKKKKSVGAPPPPIPRRRKDSSIATTIGNAFNSIAQSLGKMMTPKNDGRSNTNKSRKRKTTTKTRVVGNACRTCHNPIRKSAKGVLFCSTECSRYKEALNRTGMDVVPKQRAGRSRSVVERAKLKRVEPKKSSWGFFFTSRAAVPRQKIVSRKKKEAESYLERKGLNKSTSSRKPMKKKKQVVVKESSPPSIPKRRTMRSSTTITKKVVAPPPSIPKRRTMRSSTVPRRQTTPKSKVMTRCAPPPVVTVTKKKTTKKKMTTKREPVPKRQIFSSSKPTLTTSSSSSRVKSKKNAGESYLKRKGLSVDDILKRSSVKSKTRSTKYIPKKRSLRTQPTKPMRVNKIPGKKQRLKAWCQERAYSCGYNIKINNMSRSWKNGKAFCAIVFSACSSISKLRPEQTNSMKPAQRLKLAFDTAHVRLGVEPILEPEDITDLPRPDERCVVLYVSMLHRAISSR